MDGIGRGFPPGDMRVSDADRDRAISELSEAFQVGRLTADEFGERSEQALHARTGKELTALLADLPLTGALAPRSTAGQQPSRQPRVVVGASIAATFFAFVAIVSAISPRPTLQQREQMQEFALRHGFPMSLPPAQGFNWLGTLVPAAIAVTLVLIVIYVRITDHA
jgi:Domain of unknown function (DUF1707)